MMLRERRNSLKHVRWSFRYSGLEFAGTAVRRGCEIARRDDCYFNVRFLKSGKVCDTVA